MKAIQKIFTPPYFIAIKSLAICIVDLTIASCSPHKTFLQPNPSLTQPNSLLAIREVQKCPQFVAAEHLCNRNKYADAANQLTKLATLRKFSHYQLAYIQQQRELCMSHLVQPDKVTPPPALPVPTNKPDCGPRALALVLHHLGMPVKLADIEQHTPLTAKGCSMDELANDAKRYGLHTTGVQIARNGISKLKTPAIGWVDDNHYIAVYSLHNSMAVVHDPNVANANTISQQELLRLTGGYFLELGR